MTLTHHVSEAHRMAELLMQIEEAWCCLTCYGKFEAGDMSAHSLHCPHCWSNNIHPIYRPPILLEQYYGIIGARN